MWRKILESKMTFWGGIAGSLMAIVAALEYFDVMPARPATATDLYELRSEMVGDIKTVGEMAAENALSQLQLRLHQNRREQAQRAANNLPIENWLLQEQVDLEREQRRLEQYIQQLRAKQ